MPVEPRRLGPRGGRPFGGMKIMRTWYAADKTGFHMLHTLFQTSQVPVDQALRRVLHDRPDGRRRRLLRLHGDRDAHREMRLFRGKAVIICTGGAGRIFPFTTNGAIKTGDGMAMAYRAGVPLKDMEFVQYHPTGLPGSGSC